MQAVSGEQGVKRLFRCHVFPADRYIWDNHFAVGADRLPVKADTSAAIVGFQLNFNTLAKSAIMGLYKR